MDWTTAAAGALLLGFGVLFVVRAVRVFATGQVKLSDRIALFSTSWLLFFVASTWIVYKLSDVAAAYWMLGILAFPLVLALFYGADRHLSRTQFAKNAPGTYMTLMCLGGMLLYWPGMMLVVWLGVLFFG
jgi:hypothetical protein